MNGGQSVYDRAASIRKNSLLEIRGTVQGCSYERDVRPVAAILVDFFK